MVRAEVSDPHFALSCLNQGVFINIEPRAFSTGLVKIQVPASFILPLGSETAARTIFEIRAQDGVLGAKRKEHNEMLLRCMFEVIR